jgi:flavin reductase (DIM6/NTAB) family NADH-FMN oxidoreductase RutF
LGESKLTAKEGTERMLEAFGQIINSSCVMTFKAEEEGGEGPRVPVSWISQASFTPPGLMLALEKKDLDTWLDSSPEEQLNELFKKYDVDGSGELDRKETDPLLTEMFGVQTGTAAEEMLKAKKDEAWKILDSDGSGMVDKAEFLAAAAEGPFSEMIARERKLASFETMLGKELLGPQFTLCMLPEGMNEEEAMSALADKKKKPKNGCAAIAGCTSYLECQVRSVTAAGASSILYVEVVHGDLVDEDKRTELLRADHVAIDHESADKAAESQGELVPA